LNRLIRADRPDEPGRPGLVTKQMNQVQSSFQPLVARFPPEYQGVSAYDWFGSVAFLPVGYAITGPLAGLLTVTGTLWAAAGWTVLTTALVLIVPGVWRLRAPPPSAPAPSAV
jgi:hypothetical protein